MTRIRVFAAFAAVLAVSIATAVSFAHPSVDIVASNWKFVPATVTMHVGEATHLRLTSSEGVHGIASDDLGIAKTLIVPGKFADVDVTPKKAGTYVVKCAIVCGAGHDTMALTVKVLP